MERQSGDREYQDRNGELLDTLGLSALANVELTVRGETVKVRDFLTEDFLGDVCGDHAAAMLIGFKGLTPNHPKYQTFREALRTTVLHYVSQYRTS